MTQLSDYGALALASRFKRLSELLYAGADMIYREHDIPLSARVFPVLFLLRDNGACSLAELTRHLGQSQDGVQQLLQPLITKGYIEQDPSRDDGQPRLLALSLAGAALLDRVKPLWADFIGSVLELADETGIPLLEGLNRLEEALMTRPFSNRLRAEAYLRAGKTLEIIEYEARYRDDFKRLNLEWLERHFTVEPLDDAVLSDPEQTILAGGGQIFLARLDEEIVGTCALIRTPDRRLELSKMAVTPPYQGLNIGRRLLEHAINAFKQSDAAGLFLESNQQLTPALKLYESAGFVHAQKPSAPAHYQRADVYMEFRG